VHPELLVNDILRRVALGTRRNIDVTDGLTNGAECVIENIDYRVESSTRPSIIWVSSPHPDIGRNQHRENAHLYKATIDRNWTPVLEVTKQF